MEVGDINNSKLGGQAIRRKQDREKPGKKRRKGRWLANAQLHVHAPS